MSSSWKEVKTPEGRPYYHDTANNKTSWSKPRELFNDQERAIAELGWEKQVTSENKVYWVHTSTNKTAWIPPPEVQRILDPPEPQTAAQPTFVTSSYSYDTARRPHDRDNRPANDRDGRPDSRGGRGHGRSYAEGSSHSAPTYANRADAEAAFLNLMRKSGIDQSHTWYQAMLKTIADDQFRAIPDAATRRALFDKYIEQKRRETREQEKERVKQYREDFKKMLRTHDEIIQSTRWVTAVPLLEREKVFRSSTDDKEKENIFQEYIGELRAATAKARAEDRESAEAKLNSLFEQLGIDSSTPWKEAKNMVFSSDAFHDDATFGSLDPEDVLTKFGHFVDSFKDKNRQNKKGETDMRIRRERHAREGYMDLLHDLRRKNILTATSTWSGILPYLTDDDRYKAMLDYSYKDPHRDPLNPIELFHLEVHAEVQALQAKRKMVNEILERKGINLNAKLSKSECLRALASEHGHGLSDVDIEKIVKLHNKQFEVGGKKPGETSRRSHEHGNSAARDAFYRQLRRLDPPLKPGNTWDQVKPHVKHINEYRELSESERINEFQNAMDRMQQQEAHRERPRSSRDDHGTRSSEPDAYQADRARAVAQRERQYQDSSNGRNGFSPDHRSDSRRSGRNSYDTGPSDRPGRRGTTPPERMPRRDVGRQPSRNFGYSRADPYEAPTAALDYGDERPSSKAGSTPGSRRKISTAGDRTEAEDGRARKRQRGNKDASAGPSIAEENLRSGSEEGEIEED